MEFLDPAFLSECLWREARGEGTQGMTAVACVVRNRTLKNKSSFYAEVTKFEQFSSMTFSGDPQLSKYGQESDPVFQSACTIAQGVVLGAIQDTTGGATLYFAPKGVQTNKTYTLPDGSVIRFPKTWNPEAVEYACTIGNHVFWREV